MVEQFSKDCIPWEGPHTGAGDKYEKKGVAVMKSSQLTTMSLPPPPALLQVWSRRFISEAEPGKKEGAGEKSVSRFFFHCPTQLLSGNNLNQSSKIGICFACDGNW